MYFFRGLSDADPWANTTPEPEEPSLWDSFKSVFSSTSAPLVTAAGATSALPSGGPNIPTVPFPGTSPTTAPVVKTPWYKTPFGILLILAVAGGGFYYYTKTRKKPSA